MGRCSFFIHCTHCSSLRPFSTSHSSPPPPPSSSSLHFLPLLPPHHSTHHTCNSENGSAEFIDFLNLLGDEVELAGWEHYKGGLDTRCVYKILVKPIALPSLLPPTFSPFYRQCNWHPFCLHCVRRSRSDVPCVHQAAILRREQATGGMATKHTTHT